MNEFGSAIIHLTLKNLKVFEQKRLKTISEFIKLRLVLKMATEMCVETLENFQQLIPKSRYDSFSSL